MSKDYLVLRGSKVVFKPGHYDLEGAKAVAKIESRQHPKAIVTIVKVVDKYQGIEQ